MNRRDVVRDFGIALLVAIAGAGGIVSLWDSPWTITVPASVLLGSAALLLDLLLFRRSHPVMGRRSAIGGLTALTICAALVLALFVGRHTDGPSATYPYVVTGGGVMVLIKAAPTEKAQTDRKLSYGTEVSVDCKVRIDNVDWYRLVEGQGWLSEEDAASAPYSGSAVPPGCPRN